MPKRGLAALLCLLVAMPVLAQEGVYAGIGLGNFDYEEHMDDPFVGKISDTVSSYKIFGGFEFNDYIAIEISYGKTGTIRKSGSRFSPTLGNVDATLKLDFTNTILMAVGQWPHDWGVLLGGLGYYSYDNKFKQNATTECCGAFANEGTISDQGATAMLGIEWRIGRFGAKVGVRLEYEWLDINGADASTLGVGLSYGF